jgi:hypothetical protein
VKNLNYQLKQLRHEWSDCLPWDRSMMFDFANLALLRKQHVEVPSPMSGVISFPVAPHSCPVNDGFDTPAEPDSVWSLTQH